MRLENFIYKKKKEISFHSHPSSVLARRPFFPRPSTSPSPARLPFSRSAQLRASSLAARSASAQLRLAQQLPRQPRQPSSGNCRRRAPSPRAQPLTAWPRLSEPSPTSAPAPRASWARRPLLGLFLRAEPLPRVPLSLPAPISPPLTHRRPQQPSLRGRRIPPSASARAAIPEPSPPPFFPAVRTPSSPLSPRAVICEFRGP